MVTRDAITDVLKTIEDPELYIDIWFLGLIYDIKIEPIEESDKSTVSIEMTFTSPMCPEGPWLVEQVKNKLGEIPGVDSVSIKVVFSPPWVPSDEVKGLLGMM